MKENIYEGLKYLISYPKGFREDQKYPLVLFLHGAGTRSSDFEKLKVNKSMVNIKARQDERGYILLAPLCTEERDWNEYMSVLLRLVETVRAYSYVDKARVYVTGNSMGGYGTWEICILRPHWFASAMPLCGGGVGGFAKRLVDVPIRTFHGLCDRIVDPIESMQMVKAVNMAGGYAELILFPHLTHDCWTTVYADDKNYDWLLSFSKENDNTVEDNLSGEYYG